MTMKVFEVEFGDLGSDLHLRNDAKYHFFCSISNWNLFQSISSDLIPLSSILEKSYNTFKYKEDIEYKGIPTGGKYIDEDGYIQEYQTVTIEKHPNRLKYAITKDNILISSLRLAKSPALNFEDLENLEGYVFSNGFHVFNVQEGWNKKFILFLLRSKKLKQALDNNIYRGIGISAYKANDLLKIKIPVIAKETQDKIVAKIEPIESKIKELKLKIKQPQEVINKVFAREFGFDLKQFEELKKVKNYYLDLANFGNNIDLRQSVKFHRDAGIFVIDALKKLSTKKIKDFIAEPIVLGKSVSPKNYDESGDFYYISMANIKNWEFESEGSNLVSKRYSNQNQNKVVSKNDILIARSGEGTIGKVALIKDEELQGIFADFTMRVRLKNYNQLFAYYYFRTPYFQYLVEVNKKGLGNNTNIFPSQIREFPIIDITLPEQQKIVTEIKTELDKQEQLKQQIAEQRDKIDKLITESLT